MAFSYTKVFEVPLGKVWLVGGAYISAGGSTGGDIVTGYSHVSAISLQPEGAAILANEPVVNETYVAGSGYPGSPTIVTTGNETGSYIAVCQK